MPANIFQIFYDASTRASVNPALTPLDNSAPERPDWFEFWPIREFLRKTTLVEGDWYGFLSPKLSVKFGMDAAEVVNIASIAQEDVILFSPAWDQRAYFLNSFEQGEYWTKGLMKAAQLFIDAENLDIDVRSHVGNSLNTVFGNYLMAKPAFWRSWLGLADSLFAYGEDPQTELGRLLNSPTRYFSGGRQVMLKVFLQERLACIVLSLSQLRAGTVDLSDYIPLTPELFIDDPENRKLLQQCDLFKEEFGRARGPHSLASYANTRRAVRTVNSIPTLAVF